MLSSRVSHVTHPSPLGHRLVQDPPFQHPLLSLYYLAHLQAEQSRSDTVWTILETN